MAEKGGTNRKEKKNDNKEIMLIKSHGNMHSSRNVNDLYVNVRMVIFKLM